MYRDIQQREQSKEMSEGAIAALISVIVVIVLMFLTLIFSSWEIVSSGHMGVYVTMGKVSELPLEEGFHWKKPFISSIKEMDIRNIKKEVRADAGSKDLQTVQTTIAVNYKLDPTYVAEMYKTVGMGYDAKIIAPSIEEAVKSVTALYTAEELITKRSEVSTNLKDLLKERLQLEHIILIQTSITDFSFSDQFDKAVERKVTAEQRAIEEENNKRASQARADQLIINAEAEAKSIEIRTEAMVNKGESIIELEKIRNQERAIEKWNGVLPVNFYGNAAMPFVNVGK